MAKDKKDKKVNPSKICHFKLDYIEEVLGTASSDLVLQDTYIASKAPTSKLAREEMEVMSKAAEEKDLKEEEEAEAEAKAEGKEKPAEERTMTIFARENGKPILWDYQFKGFFKDASSMLGRIPGSLSYELTSHKKIIDGLIFPLQRKVPLHLPEGKEIGNCQRPLRASTAQGERVAIAKSETVPIGTTVDIEILLLDGTHEAVLLEWLTYGRLRGMGQWRNSGKGRLLYTLLSVKEIPLIEALQIVPKDRIPGITPEGQPAAAA